MGAAPPPIFAHDMAMIAPEVHVRALAEEDIAKGGVAAVGGPGHHDEIAVDFAREQHSVPVVREEGVLESREALEIGGFRDSYGRAVHILTPHRVVGIIDLDEARVVGVYRLERLAVLVEKRYLFGLEVPVEGVAAGAEVDV